MEGSQLIRSTAAAAAAELELPGLEKKECKGLAALPDALDGGDLESVHGDGKSGGGVSLRLQKRVTQAVSDNASYSPGRLLF